MAFQNIVFPEDISYGSRGGPGFNTAIITTRGGAEERTARWSQPRYKYDVAYGIRSFTALAKARSFFLAMTGALDSFRYKDFLDWTTFPADPSVDTITDVQQKMISLSTGAFVGDGVETKFQLVRDYAPETGFEYRRTITKPIDDADFAISIDTVAKTEGADYTVDYNTGIVTFNAAVGADDVPLWGGHYHTHVRFGEQTDDWFSVSPDSFEEGSVRGIDLIGVVNEDPVPARLLHRGNKNLALTADYTLGLQDGLLIIVDPDSSAHTIFLPDLSTGTLPSGGPVFRIFNDDGAALTFAVKDFTDTDTLEAALEPGEWLHVVLSLQDNGDLRWHSWITK